MQTVSGVFLNSSKGKVAWLFGLIFLISWQTAAVAQQSSANLLKKEVDTLDQESKSPDGRYVAKLLYRENMAMTYGYYHVTIQSLRPHKPPVDLIEVAAEGLSKLSWKGSRTLIVSYDATKHKDKLENTLFVKQPKSWRDLKIVYHPG